MKQKITIGQIDLSFHKVSAGVFHRLLDFWGYDVEIVTNPHEKMFSQQEEGNIDLLISAWLPGSHAKYLYPYKEKAILFHHIYEPYCIWGVPAYVPLSEVSQIADLNKAEVLSKMEKEINGINMGAGISRFSLEIIEEYELKGYKFKSNEFANFCQIIERKISEKSWIVIPLWHPQYLHNMFEIRPLIEPKGLLRGQDLATPILLKSSQNKISQEHRHVLSQIYLGNQTLSTLDKSLNKTNKTPYELAEEYMKNKSGSIENFIIETSQLKI